MLADSPYRHEREADIEPLRSLLLGLFFVGVGMMLDVDAVVSQPHVVLGLAVLVIAIKTLAIWSVARMFGMRGRSALSLGLLQIGRAHVCTPDTNAHLVCRLLLATKHTDKFSK